MLQELHVSTSFFVSTYEPYIFLMYNIHFKFKTVVVILFMVRNNVASKIHIFAI